MTQKEANSLIRVRFQQEIVGQEPALVVIYDNMEKSPPDEGVWVRLHIMKATAFKVENPGLHRNPGIMKASVYDLIGRGDGSIITLCDKITSAFLNKQENGVVYRTPSTITIGREEKWWRVDVDCPFHFDHQE